MEAGDQFGAGVDSPQDDPFAGSEEEFEQQDPLGPEGEPPIVNREGEVIGDGTGVPSLEDEQMLAEADRMRAESEAGELRQDPHDPAVQAAHDQAQAQLHEEAVDPTQASAPASPAVAPEKAQPEPTPSSPAAPAAAAPAASPAPSSPSTASATPQPVTTEEDAEPPQEKTDKKGTVTHRRYVIFQPAGGGKWQEIHWYEHDGKFVKKGTPGAKRQKVCLARGQDEALAVGFAAVGSPQEGAMLVAVALTYWQPKRVALDEPVEPVKRRLKIR